MPIRREAAEQLARDLFDPLIAKGLADEEVIQLTADAIVLAVRCDERDVRILEMQQQLARNALAR